MTMLARYPSKKDLKAAIGLPSNDQMRVQAYRQGAWNGPERVTEEETKD